MTASPQRAPLTTGPAETAGRVSVVVPTRNNDRTIEACLASVLAQDHADVELLVVDNHSTDATAAIARRLAHTFVTAGPERSAQRNEGIARATGEWVLWLDSDMNLPPHAISTALRTAVDTGAVGVALPERTIGTGFWTACRALERTCYLDEPWLHNPRLVRRAYLLAGGFDPAMSGPEDADLRLRMHADGSRIELAPIIVDHDEGRLTVRDVMTKRYYYGRSIPAFAAEHSGAVGSQGRVVLRCYLRHAGDLARQPAHGLGMLALRAMEAVAYSLGARRGARDAAAATAASRASAPDTSGGGSS